MAFETMQVSNCLSASSCSLLIERQGACSFLVLSFDSWFEVIADQFETSGVEPIALEELMKQLWRTTAD